MTKPDSWSLICSYWCFLHYDWRNLSQQLLSLLSPWLLCLSLFCSTDMEWHSQECCVSEEINRVIQCILPYNILLFKMIHTTCSFFLWVLYYIFLQTGVLLKEHVYRKHDVPVQWHFKTYPNTAWTYKVWFGKCDNPGLLVEIHRHTTVMCDQHPAFGQHVKGITPLFCKITQITMHTE